MGKNPVNITVLGVQSSGKSTLLNEAFGLDFKVMNCENISQTTCGIWINCDHKKKRVIYDLEGIDSTERQKLSSEKRENLEFNIATLSLVYADILLVNVKTESIGAVSTGCYTKIKEAFMFAIACRDFERKKKIMFLLRDFNHRKHYLENIKE